ncbi:MAG: hypothetical protein FJ284_01275 [Planctomycetes bacterium]|nr:hypothetical protein [Planctomycetota bacterium]MBM4058940.1 hypothetical protein [Planctomycetota bacterium]
MIQEIACSCGYSGPGRADGPTTVCPLCGETAQPVAEAKVWQIPCPNGHVSRVPNDCIGRRLICPKCNDAFLPRVADSIEKRKEERRRQEREEAKFAKIWLTRALLATGLFLVMLVALILTSVMQR